MTNFNNIQKLSEPTREDGFKLPSINPRPELFAKKAIEKVAGHSVACATQEHYRRSSISKSAVLDDFLAGDIEYHECIYDDHFDEALTILKSELNPAERFKTVHFCGLRFIPFNKSSSPGLPYVNMKEFHEYVKYRFDTGKAPNKQLTKSNGLNIILDKERVKVHQIKEGQSYYELLPMTRIYARSHLVDKSEEDKVRAVYASPMTLQCVEMMLLFPMVNHLMNKEAPFIAWNYATFTGGLHKLQREFRSYESFVSFDFSKFDKRIPYSLIDKVHALWKSMYNLGPYYTDDPLYPRPSTDPIRIERLWTFMNDAIKHGIFVAPDGSKYKRRHSGLPSGAYQTQILGSCANYLMITSALLAVGLKPNQFKLKILGDDSCVAMNLPISEVPLLITKVAEYVSTHFNAIINAKKTTFGLLNYEVSFLSYTMLKGVVKRTRNDLLGKLMYPEDGQYQVQKTKSRALGIMIANLGHCRITHEVCAEILRTLTHVEYNLDELNYFDQERLAFAMNKFSDRIPDRSELAKLAFMF
uniref:RdRp n=1 Tax=viral metagenome TaxID=1070528 RepID=A0A8J9SKC2_9ZZZZ